MSEKKYYWLKLQKDFFKRHDIRVIEAMPNGKDYILFYLKLLVESVSHEGKLRFSDTIPYNEDMLAVVTDTNVDIVRAALKVFVELGMIEMLEDATIYMAEVEKMIGSAADNDNAKRQAKFRAKKREEKALLELDEQANVTKNNREVMQSNGKDNESKSIELELEKELDLETELERERNNTDYLKIVSMYNETCVSFPRISKLSDKRKKALKARSKIYTLDDFKLLFEKAEGSNFLKGGNNRNWSANFDWLIQDANMAKVLDGNYDNKSGTKATSKTAQNLYASYDMMNTWAAEGDK